MEVLQQDLFINEKENGTGVRQLNMGFTVFMVYKKTELVPISSIEFLRIAVHDGLTAADFVTNSMKTFYPDVFKYSKILNKEGV